MHILHLKALFYDILIMHVQRLVANLQEKMAARPRIQSTGEGMDVSTIPKLMFMSVASIKVLLC